MNINTNSKISNKLANSKKAIGNNLSKPQTATRNSIGKFMNHLSDYSNSFRHAMSREHTSNPNNNAKNKIKNSINITNNVDNAIKEPQNLYIIGIVIFIAFAFLIYGTYTYLSSTSMVRASQTFYGENLLNYEPLFNINVDKIEPCIDRCTKDSLCAGITFDKDTLTCVASKRGKLRADTNNYSSWIKPPMDMNVKSKTLTLLGYTSGRNSIKSSNMPMPYSTDSMAITFMLYVDDFYTNHGTWKHILHRGTQLEQPIKTAYWEDVIKVCPDQYCGVWMSPFNNNIRVCMTTITDKAQTGRTTYPHANSQAVDPNTGRIYITDKPDNPMADPLRYAAATSSNQERNNSAIAGLNMVKSIEYIDIANIPTKKLIHVAVQTLVGGTLEVYLNGKLHQILGLHGHAEYNNGDLYVMHPASYKGDLLDLTYTPRNLDKNEIQGLASRLDSLTGKYAK